MLPALPRKPRQGAGPPATGAGDSRAADPQRVEHLTERFAVQRLGVGDQAIKIEDDRFRPAQGLDNGHPAAPPIPILQEMRWDFGNGRLFAWGVKSDPFSPQGGSAPGGWLSRIPPLPTPPCSCRFNSRLSSRARASSSFTRCPSSIISRI